MPHVYNMKVMKHRPINGLVDIADYLLVILCDVILDIDDHQGFFLHDRSSWQVNGWFGWLYYHTP
ncbi:hypothetical protein SDC9_198472 [bioreactor metagenome]|uniref:Uncharacterized protein n=1 Tax=bioreactor metagenome TaxID=1076179 RepID=A0A645IUK7_9ZZZZ